VDRSKLNLSPEWDAYGKWYAREMDRLGDEIAAMSGEPSMSIDRAVDEAVEGRDVVDILDSLVEAADPMPVRKLLRKTAPRLYQWLSGNGTLHDFALDVATGRMRKPEHFERKFDIPKSMRGALTAVLGG
jgi:hypothetical protein